MRDWKAGKREISSDRFASSKSSNWKPGAQVQPTREKCSSGSLDGSLKTSMLSEISTSLAGNAPNQTFGGTVYWTCWCSAKTSGPRQVNLPVPPWSSNSNTWKKKKHCLVLLILYDDYKNFGGNYHACQSHNQQNQKYGEKKFRQKDCARHHAHRQCTIDPLIERKMHKLHKLC